MDVKRPCPVSEYALLCDEAVMAASASALVGDVHGAFVWPQGLVIMVWDGRALGFPVENCNIFLFKKGAITKYTRN